MITGFLGAGKTTFLKNFIHLFSGRKIQLIVNEFGQEGVDGALLSGLGAFLEEISGGSVFCSCRMDQFEKALRESAEIEPDVILVEASGLSDPTGVRKLFAQTSRFPHIQYEGAMCLIDAIRFPKLYATARTCVKQLASSDLAVVNKVDQASREQLNRTLDCIRGQRPDIPILQTSFGRIDGSILSKLSNAEKRQDDKLTLTADLTLRRVMISVSGDIPSYDLQKFIEMFSEYAFRVKGFVQTSEGLRLADCVGNMVKVEPCEKISVDQDGIGWLNVLSGVGMPIYKAVQEACKWYPQYVLKVEKG